MGGGSGSEGGRRSSMAVSSLPVGGTSKGEGRNEEEESGERDRGDHVVRGKEGRKEGRKGVRFEGGRFGRLEVGEDVGWRESVGK